MEEEKPGDEQIKKLEEWYAEQLKSKDKIIEELRKENSVLMKTALRQAERTKEWQEMVQRFAKQDVKNSKTGKQKRSTK